MEDLAKFFADIIEFVVGGVFLAASVLLLAYAVAPDAIGDAADHLGDPPAGLNGLYTIAGLAVVYALGIVAEGASRQLLEWKLRLLTVSKFAKEDVSDPDALKEDLVARDLREERKALVAHEETLRALERSPLTGRIWGLRLKLSRMRPGKVRDYTIPLGQQDGTPAERPLAARWQDLSYANAALRDKSEKLREKWRTTAGTTKDSYAATINTQLKRLRIERSLFLSSCITVLALLWLHQWLLGAVLLLCTYGLYKLVEERFSRFLEAIVNCYSTASSLKLLPDGAE